jgi:radical SAM superfamily enzyme YgiQ (UPF0313 family)
MKIRISYPPLESTLGIPLLSQNRQFQWFSDPTYIYPIVPAYAATLLSNDGHKVIWDDAIAEEKSYQAWFHDIEHNNFDLMMIETKTPVVKRHWNIINDLKQIKPDVKFVLVGDHVTALPGESMDNCEVDFVLTGGDYDFLLQNLIRYLNDEVKTTEPGIWYRKNGVIKTSGPFISNHDLNLLPNIDRTLTKWHLYAEKNGNYKITPGTYTMVGRDCWWRYKGGCTFCSWPTLYPTYRVRTAESLVSEVGTLIEDFNVKEIFDDTGTFPVGKWLKTFCRLMIDEGYNEKINFNINMRFGALSSEDYSLLKKAGFRMLLFGLESANQTTLDRLNKGTLINTVANECKTAIEAKLEPHITVMIGYPWETRTEVNNTLQFSKMLMQRGLVSTLQSTVIIPYPGTQLFDEAVANGWFEIDPTDYDNYHMKKPVLKTPDLSGDEIMELCNETYKLFFSPNFILNSLKNIHSWKDFKYALKGVKKILGHLNDFT